MVSYGIEVSYSWYHSQRTRAPQRDLPAPPVYSVVRTLAEFSEAEIAELERRYGMPVRRPNTVEAK
jgi:hypothetical protein